MRLAVLAVVLLPVLAGCQSTTRSISPEQDAINRECSAQADARQLHGKERMDFRATCKSHLQKDGKRAN